MSRCALVVLGLLVLACTDNAASSNLGGALDASSGGGSATGGAGISQPGAGGASNTGGAPTGAGGTRFDHDAATDAGPGTPTQRDACNPIATKIASTVLTIATDPADIYYPDRDGATLGPFPIALVLQGANVDKKYYSGFARGVASYGFIVAVPNHQTLLGLFADQVEVPNTLSAVAAEGVRPGAPIEGLVDGTKMVLLGHSYGGVAGLGAIQGTCGIPFCTGTFTRPRELLAGAFYGTNLGASPPAVPNQDLGVALVQGTVDGKAFPADGRATYDRIVDPPRAFFSIAGANHYGVCDLDNPPGAAADTNVPTGSRENALDGIVQSAGRFLRAALNDRACARTIADSTDAGTSVVTVTSDLR